MGPIGSSNSSLIAATSSEMLQPGNVDVNEALLLIPLTTPEKILLMFLRAGIRQSLDNGYTTFFIGSSEPMQTSFNDWVGKSVTSKQFTEEELKLFPIISSIWEKTRNLIDGLFIFLKNPDDIKEENHWKNEAEKMTERLSLEGRKGCTFTVRQIVLSLLAIEECNISS